MAIQQVVQQATSSLYQEINKHITEIEKLCRANSIPILITYANPVTEEYVHEVITPKSLGIELKDDKISKLNIALNKNFSIKIKNDSPEKFVGDMFDSIIDEL